MKAILVQLSPHEETALRKIGFGSADAPEPAHLRRLLNLQLIEWTGQTDPTWRLTVSGRQHYACLVVDTGRPSFA